MAPPHVNDVTLKPENYTTPRDANDRIYLRTVGFGTLRYRIVVAGRGRGRFELHDSATGADFPLYIVERATDRLRRFAVTGGRIVRVDPRPLVFSRRPSVACAAGPESIDLPPLRPRACTAVDIDSGVSR